MRPNVSLIHKEGGFTLIEILVVLVISALMVSSGMVAYFRFRDRQVAKADADQVVEFLRLSQRRALAGEKPSECAGLQFDGYEVSVDTVTKTLRSAASCGSAVTPENSIVTTSVIDTSRPSWLFAALNGATTTGQMYFSYGSVIYKVSIGGTGSVEYPLQVANVGE